MNNLDYIKKQIKKKKWTPDCCGKQDLDLPILSISTRYWPDFTAEPSFILGNTGIYDDEPDDGDYKVLLESKDYIKGESEEDCKTKVKQWYIDNLKTAIEKLLNK